MQALAYIIPVLLCGSETWATTEKLCGRLDLTVGAMWKILQVRIL